MSKFDCRKAIKDGKCNNAECCGIIPFSPSIFSKNKHKILVSYIISIEISDFILLDTEDSKCVFLNRETNECLIYDERPNLCRIFGDIEGLLCPCIKGDGTYRNRQERRALRRNMDKEVYKKISKLRNTINKFNMESISDNTQESSFFTSLISNNDKELEKIDLFIKIYKG